VSTLNTGEIDAGMLELQQGQIAEARDFAQMMVTMHTAAQQRAMSIMQMLDITPAANATSDQMSSDADAMRMQLANTDAAQFDQMYVRSQVDMHMKALSVMDSELLPNATADALKADLMTARGEVAAHLQLATDLLQRLMSSTGTGGTP
jgi:putative membrane protein